MEADMSKDTVSKQESWWYKFQSKNLWLKTQEELTFQFKSKGRKRLMSQLCSKAGGAPFYSWEGPGFLFYSGFQLII